MRLLVVEDHPNLAPTLVEGLRDEGYAVDLAMDGEEGEHLARAVTYDCIVMDVMLPGKDGWALLAALRTAGIASPVLLLTARDAVEDRVRGLNLGGDDYLPKPFAWDELVARVRALVRRSHGRSSSRLEVGDLAIDTAAKSVRRGGREISLTAREYALLELLALRQGAVVSRAEIWERLYDANDESTSNVVDVYVGYLRAKIDKGHATKLIHTRRGLGYVLTDTGGDAP